VRRVRELLDDGTRTFSSPTRSRYSIPTSVLPTIPPGAVSTRRAVAPGAAP
jgi:hypothetical protein